MIEDENCDKIDSFPLLSSGLPSFVTHDTDPTLELKPLPNSLKYVFLGPNDTYPVIIASDLTKDQEEELLKVRKTKRP